MSDLIVKRFLLSYDDALYCSYFIFALVSYGASGFNYLDCVWKLLSLIGEIIQSCTEKEALILGVFVNSLMENHSRILHEYNLSSFGEGEDPNERDIDEQFAMNLRKAASKKNREKLEKLKKDKEVKVKKAAASASKTKALISKAKEEKAKKAAAGSAASAKQAAILAKQQSAADAKSAAEAEKKYKV